MENYTQEREVTQDVATHSDSETSDLAEEIAAPEPVPSVDGFRLPSETDVCNAGVCTTSGAAQTAKDEKGFTHKDMLLMVADSVELWHDAELEAFVTFGINGKKWHTKIRAKEFKDYLCMRVFRDFKVVPSVQSVEDTLRMLEGKAKYDSPQHETRVRIAGDSSTTYLHLADDAGTVFRVDRFGVVDASDASDASVRFLTKSGMRVLPNPILPENDAQALETLNRLRDFCNIKDDGEWLLFLVSLLSAFRPAGPYVVVLVVGEQGSAKSTLCRIFRKLVDPSKAPLRTAPKSEQDLWIAASNGWIVAFDNVSRISVEISDAICRLTTGGGSSYRTLYQDESETIFQAQRLVLLNTIDDLSLRNDMVDRAIQIDCPRIDEKDRLPESEFWTNFDANEAKFLGAILFVLSKTLRELPGVKIDRSPRMADFAKYGVAVERALGLPGGRFLDVYNGNRQALAAVALDDQLTQLILDLDLPIQNSATDLRELLIEKSGSPGDKLPRWFPTNAQQLSSKLRRLAPFLRQRHGLEIQFSKSGSRKISISRLDGEGGG